MELLIPGLIIVALMVWASTKIKRISAAAFEPEVIEMPLYSIQKPDGFLHILNDESGLDFRAYSRELETIGRLDYRTATIEVEIFDRKTLEERISEIRAFSKEISVSNYLDGGERSAIVRNRRKIDNAEYAETRKIITRDGRLIELRVAVLEDRAEDFSAKVEQIIEGFTMKV
ncbi:MAG: hypothetical protein ACK42A_08220 [Pyrinomonadaceae bacterium]|jgi:hypothetical protein